MNIQERDILYTLFSHTYINQRVLSEISGHSLGIVNKSLKNLVENQYLDSDFQLTQKGLETLKSNKPENAIILAAGFGMRMVPINLERPKALLNVNGEVLIERIIRQLHEAGIRKIYIVVGFMKELFEYLIDDFDVELICNTQYATKNNLHSLTLAADKLNNSYIIPCDIWADDNPFHEYEPYSWYMVNELVDNDSTVRVNRKMELVETTSQTSGNSMVGISYLTSDICTMLREKLTMMDANLPFQNSFWEDALFENGKMIVPARLVHATDVIEINTYEQLRELDEQSNHLKSDAISTIMENLNVEANEITDITVLKKGMTNRSFLFSCNGKKYIMRIPGEGTDKLIDRKQEAAVYHAIQGYQLCDDPVYINPSNGYKITTYIENVGCADAEDETDLQNCMEKLRYFHSLNLQVNHTFDLFEKIEFYESLWEGTDSIYKDYKKVKEQIFSLKSFIESTRDSWCLTHIDAVPDNFLFQNGSDKKTTLQLTDWEYAGMQDPHVDIAMFCIYALYDKEQIDHLINLYFQQNCPADVHAKIYCYIATCGLLWSNWCEYKRNLGVEFGEYSLRQYRFAKEYYKLAIQEIQNLTSRKDENHEL